MAALQRSVQQNTERCAWRGRRLRKHVIAPSASDLHTANANLVASSKPMAMSGSMDGQLRDQFVIACEALEDYIVAMPRCICQSNMLL